MLAEMDIAVGSSSLNGLSASPASSSDGAAESSIAELDEELIASPSADDGRGATSSVESSERALALVAELDESASSEDETVGNTAPSPPGITAPEPSFSLVANRAKRPVMAMTRVAMAPITAAIPFASRPFCSGNGVACTAHPMRAGTP